MVVTGLKADIKDNRRYDEHLSCRYSPSRSIHEEDVSTAPQTSALFCCVLKPVEIK